MNASSVNRSPQYPSRRDTVSSSLSAYTISLQKPSLPSKDSPHGFPGLRGQRSILRASKMINALELVVFMVVNKLCNNPRIVQFFLEPCHLRTVADHATGHFLTSMAIVILGSICQRHPFSVGLFGAFEKRGATSLCYKRHRCSQQNFKCDDTQLD
ncbi:hypothetical protein LIPSTDRAFT_138817 [Lipomyces starkeyi NRRL Y-11557]|uniref:Uncharacterized protein n=1 Tax=Lipomyces starkeyi NRRL Y-11557 TaxID=675824 RepID=A0A1E3QFY4_LIPST|nr:hypothetical protein LIPSTDRAFT_138817 [Lipomyces starkeyi NRRL Y-11557]